MKILHYFLGFAPYRSGGLTRFCMDLMADQAAHGDEVIALWPGRMGLADHRVRLTEHDPVKGVRNIELVNPLPVPLDEGIQDPGPFMKSTDRRPFAAFLEKEKPDVLHIHTLMGLYGELVETARDLKIRIVFTSHDYFGICPLVSLFHDGAPCDSDRNCADCAGCGRSALSLRKIFLMQSVPYRVMKDSAPVRALRKRHKLSFYSEAAGQEDGLKGSGAAPEDRESLEKTASEYRALRRYYLDILAQADIIHYNSTVVGQVYERYISPENALTIPISHGSISDHRQERNWQWTGKLRITYLSQAKSSKGYFWLKEALDRLWEEGKRDFELKLFTPVGDASPYMNVREQGFSHSELKDVFDQTDILAAPALWYETFGFTVLEALSYGVPVLVSDRLGARDIIAEGAGVIVKGGDTDDLCRAVRGLTGEKVLSMNRAIRDKQTILMLPEVAESIRSELYADHP